MQAPELATPRRIQLHLAATAQWVAPRPLLWWCQAPTRQHRAPLQLGQVPAPRLRLALPTAQKLALQQAAPRHPRLCQPPPPPRQRQL